MSSHARTNRRATTHRPVVDNRIFEIRVFVEGFGVARSTHYYRRHTARCLYTGPAPIGSVHGFVRTA